MHLNYDNYKRGASYTPSRNDEYTVHDLTKTSLSGSHTSGKITHKVANSSAGFAHKVRTILQIRARDKYSYAQKRGKLNSSSLHRIVVPNAPGYADRVFKRREVNNVLDAAVTLVVDQSGSMAGEKYYNAGAAAAMLSDTIANTLHIPVEIVSFTSMRDNVLYVHRTFKDKLVPRDKLIARLGYSAEQGMDGNADGDAIMWAFDRLVKRPEKRKLVVVFSDGSPSGCGGRGDIVEYTRQVVKGIENESPVDIVGIGIMDRNVELFYKENYVIDDSSQLETALLSLIENKLK
jgi:cobaltochelatase CobT